MGGLMATSRVAAVIDALVTTFSASATLTGIVRDGPRLDLAKDQEFVVVGHDGTEDPDGPAASSTQNWVGIGTNNRRDEQIEVTCACVAWFGDNYPNAASLARARVYELFDACEDAILADVTLGVGVQGTPGSARNSMIGETDLFQSNDGEGCRARLVFSVSCIARL